ncbi:MAG: leucine-rich repeat domain-containing protein [Candidatus Eremiobacteraeota bacterium]|nr:leucine-rich repeat domain-containing protein [Candidatus Eremiobacteraeota bacterium]
MKDDYSQRKLQAEMAKAAAKQKEKKEASQSRGDLWKEQRKARKKLSQKAVLVGVWSAAALAFVVAAWMMGWFPAGTPSALSQALANPKVSELSIPRTSLTKLPDEISTLTALKKLDVSENSLTELPAGVASLTKLQTLQCRYNQLERLPAGLGNLDSLRELDCSGNKLTSLPDDWAGLKKLNKLDVSKNQLTELPWSIGELRTLTHFSARNNQLGAVPEGLGKLTNLVELDLSYNPISTLPDLSKLTHLRTLNLRSTKLPAAEKDRLRGSLPSAQVLF